MGCRKPRTSQSIFTSRRREISSFLTIYILNEFDSIGVFIPNRTFLVRFGGISGEFGRAMVRILARRSRAKIPMVRPNELDMLPKRTKKGAIRYLRTVPKFVLKPGFFFQLP